MRLLHAGRHLGRGLYHSLTALAALQLSPPGTPQRAADRMSAHVAGLARAHDLEIRVHGALPTRCALIVANHVSYLDPIAILSVTPALPLAKYAIAGWPLVGALARRFGVVFVERDDPHERVHALRRVHDLLRAGVSVLNFPEGTTTPGDHVAPFWRGSFGIAQRLGVPIVPLALRYGDPALAWFGDASFVPHYVRTIQRPRVELSLAFGAPMHHRPGETAQALAARARGLISQMLEPTRSTDAGPSPRLSSPRSDSVLPAAGMA